MKLTSIPSSRLWLLLICSHAKGWCTWLPKGVGSLPRWLGTEGRHCRRLAKGRLIVHASKGRLRLEWVILLLSCSKHTCKNGG